MFSYNILNHILQVNKTIVRFKNPPHHWSVVRRKTHPVDKALAHFDDFYMQVFDKHWPKIREGLLGKRKYVAVINNFGDAEKAMSKLELSGAINVRTLFNLEKEYIKEQLDNQIRNKKLEKIWQMERKMENKEDIVNSANECSDEIDVKKLSLEASLKEAEIDSRRIVDPDDILSSEILHEYVPATRIKGKEDYVAESSHYGMYDTSTEYIPKIEREYDFHFPEHLNIYCYEKGNTSNFEGAKLASTGVLNYYLMDGGSVLPVLALDLKPGDTLLDMCSAPGGKSLLAIQTLYPDCVVSNDISQSRLNRVHSVYKQFLYDFHERWLQPGRIRLTKIDGRSIVDENFSKILVDVPCTTDRNSLHENDNNIFKPTRIKERLKLPEIQTELLYNALKLVNIGGVVVYSTCSLSPIQNDGVVHMAIKKISEETKLKIVVKDLSPALLQAQKVFDFADQHLLKYGHLVLPSKAQNYGPTYFCKLKRIK